MISSRLKRRTKLMLTALRGIVAAVTSGYRIATASVPATLLAAQKGSRVKTRDGRRGTVVYIEPGSYEVAIIEVNGHPMVIRYDVVGAYVSYEYPHALDIVEVVS
jgi:hypothetical protein